MRASQRGNALFRARTQPLRQPRAPTSRQTCACGATTPGTACYRMAVGGVSGGEAFGAPHVSLLMVPATPRRIDARGSDSL